MNPSTTPTMVVKRIIFQNVRPIPAIVRPFIFICSPNMPKIKKSMKIRNALLRTNAGMGL